MYIHEETRHFVGVRLNSPKKNFPISAVDTPIVQKWPPEMTIQSDGFALCP